MNMHRLWEMIHGPRLLQLEPFERARAIHQHVNKVIKYRSDEDSFNAAPFSRSPYYKGDYWRTAVETLESGRGDCEDYAILKLQLLVLARIPVTELSLEVCFFHYKKKEIVHAVACYKPQPWRQYILDNYNYFPEPVPRSIYYNLPERAPTRPTKVFPAAALFESGYYSRWIRVTDDARQARREYLVRCLRRAPNQFDK